MFIDSNAAIVRTTTGGRTIAVVGDLYRFLATGAETAGQYAMWEAIVPPGGGPPAHIHRREQESFYVLEGTITFQVGEEQVVATAGMFAHIPMGTLHRFRNTSDKPARMIITVVPAGIEEMFFEVGKPLELDETPSPPTHEEIARLLAAAPRYGVEILPPPH